MFSHLLLQKIDVSSQLYIYQLYANTTVYPETKQPVCTVQSWLMGSCAAMSIQRVQNVGGLEEVDTLFAYLCAQQWDNCWNPDEIFFLLTLKQASSGIGKLLAKHPNVRKVDSFTNKAHGSNLMCLYRYSKANDFPKESICKS